MSETLHTVPELVAYALFDLDPRVREAQRPLHSFLISLALYRSDQGLDQRELHSAAVKLMPLDDAVTSEVITEEEISLAVELNLDLDLLCLDNDGRLRLSRERRRQLDDAQSRLAQKKQAFHDHMLASVENMTGSLSDKDRETLYSALERRLVELLQERSSTVASAWSTNGKGFDTGLPDLNAREHLKEVASALGPGGAGSSKLRRTAVTIGLNAGLYGLPKEAEAYLAALYHQTVALALLKQDPHIRRVKSQLASSRIAYLDANVLFAAMFEADPQHSEAVQVLQLTQALGAKLRATLFTVDELTSLIGKASESIGDIHKSNSETEPDDIVVRSYLEATRKLPGLQWPAFIGGLDPPFAWLTEHGIDVDSSKHDETTADNRIADVKAAIEDARPQVTPKVAEVDALNIVHISRQRKAAPPDEMGNRVWLVSFDRSLSRAERQLVEREILPGGVSRLAHSWVGILSPCLPPDQVQLSGYVTHLVQSQFNLLADDPVFSGSDLLPMLNESHIDVTALLKASPERASQTIIRVREDAEVKELMSEPTPEPTGWNIRMRAAVERAVKEVEQSSEHIAELDSQRRARLSAEQSAEQERHARQITMRQLAEVRKEAQLLREAIERSKEESDQSRIVRFSRAVRQALRRGSNT